MRNNTLNKLKTSPINQIWSSQMVLEPMLKFDQRLTKFDWLDEISQDLIAIFLHYDHLIVNVLHKHKYLTTFCQSNNHILDLNLLHDGHVSLYPPTKKLWLTLFTQSDHLIKLKFAKTNIWPHSFNIMVKLWIWVWRMMDVCCCLIYQ